MGEEKKKPSLRKHKRLKFRLHVRYLNLTNIKKNRYANPFMTRKLGFITNISKNGLSMLVSSMPKVSDIFDMELSLPLKEKNQRISVTAVVRWARIKNLREFPQERFREYEYCCGIEFLHTEHREEIQQFVEYIQSFSLE
jgi:hypothetical protein